MAAARERRTIPFARALRMPAARRATRDVTLIEGIGGVMVPLDAEHTVLDWIAALGAPALLVVGSYLGTLSHSLTAAAALRQRGVTIAGVVVSESRRATRGGRGNRGHAGAFPRAGAGTRAAARAALRCAARRAAARPVAPPRSSGREPPPRSLAATPGHSGGLA